MAQRQDLINNALQKLKNTAQSLGRGTTNFINKAPGAIGQFGSENFIQPTVKSTYQASKPILDYLDPRGYSKNDTGKLIGAAKAAPKTAFNLFGLSQMKPASTIANYGIGGIINAAIGDKSQSIGQRFMEGGRKGLQVAPTIAGIGAFTNPLISQGASALSSGFTNPLIQQAISRGATGLMNIPEGMLMKKSMTDEKYNLKDAAFDFGIGALAGGYKPRLRVKGIDKGAVFENPQAKRIGQLAIKFDKEGNLSIDEIDEVTKLAAEKLDVPRKQLNKMNPGQMLAELQGLFTKNQDYAYTNLPRNQGMTMGLMGGSQAKGYDQAPNKFSSLADKKPRFEIDDSKFKLLEKGIVEAQNNAEQAGKTMGQTSISNLIDHPELFKQYPELKKMKVYLNSADLNSSYNPKTNIMQIGTAHGNIQQTKSDLLHEIQHIIQTKEGFASGGSPNTVNEIFRPRLLELNKKIVELEKIGKNKRFTSEELKNYNDLLNEQNKLSKQLNSDSYRNYNRLSGEIEARDSASRMNLNSDQRVRTQPYASQGIPVKDQIVSYDSEINANTPQKLYKSGEIPPPPKQGSGEQILEAGLGFKPGMKREFDLAMLTKDKAKVTALLPDIPESYKAKFKSDIDTIMGKPALRTSVPKGSYTNIPGADNPLLNKSSEDPFIKGLEEDQNKVFKAPPETPKPNKPVQKDFIDEMETIKKGANIDKKVNILDYFRTPDRVLEKIGMKKEANGIRMAYDDYKGDLKSEIGRITKWYEQAPSPESSQRIFKYLDGQPVKLEGTELKVAKEIETYLADWAEKLGLPKDKRIANYITHIFDFDAAQKEFDPEIARLIQDRVPGSVYNPFLEKRLGKLGYKENVWQALDAYVKRATRKVNMDPALANLSKASEGLDIESFNYVKRYGDRINMRPTEMDNLIDNMIKQSPVGYKYGSRPTTVLSSKIRQTVGRATLGLNIGSAVKNLSQGVNTYAKLGEKYTVIGYTKLLGKMASRDLSELYDVGVLDDAVIQDRQLNAVKSVTQKLDSALFAMFDMAEKINRGSAYFGAKSKAISDGMDEEQAIEYAKKIVRDTQFTFGSVDTPVALSSDIVKTLAQFQTYSLKQTEFLGEMVKEKDLKGLIRYTGASIALYMTVGKALGWNIKDIIPSFRMDSPIVQQAGNIGTLLNPNETGNAKRKALIKQLKLVVPGGTQIGKTIEGFQTADQGYGTNAKGDFLYAVDQSPANKLKASVFGKNSLQETQSYYDSKSKSPLKQMAMTSDMGIPDLVKDFFKPKEKTPYQKAELKKLDEKKAEAELKTSDKGYVIVNDKLKTLTDTGGTNTLDYGKVASMPESTTMEKIKKQKEAYKIVDNILNSSIDEGDKEEILMKLGVSRQDAEYYQLAQESDDVKMGYISDAAGTMKERKDYLTFLAKGRKQINGKMIVSDGVLKDLYDSKVITKDDYEKLKNIVFKDGQPFVKMTGRGKGARIKKIKLGTLSPRLKALVGSRSPSIDTSRLKIQQPQMAKLPQIYQMPQNLLS